MSIKVARGFELPIEIAGEAIGILAKRGAGKTNTGVVLVEEFFRAAVQTVILDPVGVWWGLRSRGTKEGLPIPVLGGEHGDVSLAATAGSLIADVVVDTGQSLVLDLSDFLKNEQRRFVADFATRLYRRKARSKSLLHLVLEEADEFAPQRVTSGDAPMVGAITSIVKRGRSRGLGMTYITQRSASLNKDVLDQADVLIAMRTHGPRDRKAIEGWIEHQDTEISNDVLRSLPSLPTGTAWVFNPERSIFEQIKVRKRHTFDSSRTPQAGEQRATPTVVPIDLTKLGQQIEATAEKAKENDPKVLRGEITKLRRQLDNRPQGERVEVEVERVVEVEKVVEVPVINSEEVKALREAIGRFDDFREAMGGLVEEVRKIVDPILPNLDAAHSWGVRQARLREQPPPPRPGPVEPPDHGKPRRHAESNGDRDGEVGSQARKVLQVLAQYRSGRTKAQVAVLAGYSTNSGGFNSAFSTLRKLGYADGHSLVRITESGLEYLGGDWEALPTGRALLDLWLARLKTQEAAILRTLAEVYPDTTDKQEVAVRCGYSMNSGGFNAAFSKLRKLELIEGHGQMRASPMLFMDAVTV